MLQIQNLTITYKRDLRVLLRNFSYTLNKGDKTVLIGEEGNGKSTLLKWIYDPSLIEDYAEASGRISMRNEKCGYLPQELPMEERNKTVYEYFLEEELFLETDARYLNEIAGLLGMQYDDFYSDQIMNTLSGGEKVRTQIARILIGRPTILLLDEPSNDLDLKTLEWLESFIKNTELAVLFISHDETLIEHTANRIIHIELLKRKTDSRYTAVSVGYKEYLKRRSDLFDRQMQNAVSERRADRERMERYRKIQSSVEHDLRNVSRQDPHSGFLLKKKMASVKALGKRFERARENMTEITEQEQAILTWFHEDIRIPSGKTVLEYSLKELHSPDGRLLSKDIELNVYGPSKICIIGDNGSGKTTLLKMIAEELLSRTDIKAAYMPQNYEELLDQDQTPAEFLASDGMRDTMTKVRNHLGAMRFTTDEMEHAVSDLSGGQKAKVLLLKMNLDGANVLILDEPTRNFSPLSSPVIRNALKEFGGCIISVSHDRKYIEEVCDQVYELTPGGLNRYYR